MKRYVRYIFAATGIIIFAVLIHRMGPEKIIGHLNQVGWWMIPIFCCSIAWYISYTFAWHQFLKPRVGKIRPFELFKIKIIGEMANLATPINFVGGDPLRAYMLRHRFPMTEGAASVVVDRTIQIMATLVVVLIGMAVALTELHFLPKNIKYGLPIALAVAIAFVGFIFVHQHKGLFGFLADIARRFRIKKSFSIRTLEKFEEVDGHIQDFYKNNKRGFWTAFLSHLFSRFLGILEVLLIGHAVDPKFSFGTALILAATAPLINFTFTFIPGALGIIEGTYSAILYFLGFPPTIGLTIQVIRRLRAVIWIVISFIFLGTRGRKELLNLQTFPDNTDQTRQHP